MKTLVTIKKLFYLLNQIKIKNKYYLAISTITAFLVGLTEILLLSLIAVFISSLDSNTTPIQSSPISYFQNIFIDFEPFNQPIYLSGVGLIIVSLLLILFRILHLYLYSLLSTSIGMDLTEKSINSIYSQEYSFFNTNTSSSLITRISYLRSIATQVIQPFILSISSALSAIFLLIFLIASEPYLAFTALTLLVSLYVVTVLINKPRLKSISEVLGNEESVLLNELKSSFSAIKEVIIARKIGFFSGRIIEKTSLILNQYRSLIFYMAYPRIVIEGFSIVLIASLALTINITKPGTSAIVPLGILLIGIQRLLPSIQIFYQSFSSLTSSQYIIDSTFSLLKLQGNYPCSEPIPLSSTKLYDKALFDEHFQSLKIDDLSFSYGTQRIFNRLSFSLLKSEKIAIVGPSGSGKSTLLDILLGLRIPSSCSIHLNNSRLQGSNLAFDSWWSKLTYVPQGFYLTGNTIIENIAFGVPCDEIDFENISTSLYLSMLDSFVDSLPLGLHTEVGENGSLLSGGQKQRLSIARSLYFYNRNKILVFDEATSALDKDTENTILMRIIVSLNPTFVCVTHRLETLTYFDKIIQLE